MIARPMMNRLPWQMMSIRSFIVWSVGHKEKRPMGGPKKPNDTSANQVLQLPHRPAIIDRSDRPVQKEGKRYRKRCQALVIELPAEHSIGRPASRFSIAESH
jgi:hypothetical protein